MGRSSRWPDALWDYCARLRKRSWTYEKIYVDLNSPENRKRFGYDEPPSTDTISRQIKGRGLVAEVGSPLPRGELEVHHRELRFLLLGIRERIELPRGLTFEMSSRHAPRRRQWCGFGMTVGRRYEPSTPEEEDVEDAWANIDPRDHPLYENLVDHIDASLDGAKIKYALDEVYKASECFVELQSQLYATIVERLNPDSDPPGPDVVSAAFSVLAFLDRKSRAPNKAPRVGFMPPVPGEDLKDMAKLVAAEFEHKEIVRDLSAVLDRIAKPQSNLKSKLGSATGLWRIVQAGEGKCELCSFEALAVPIG